MLDLTPMIEPTYTSWPEGERIRLHGRILVFGAGQLLHEAMIFDFNDVESVLAYDPFVELDIARIPSPLKNKTTYQGSLDSVEKELAEAGFDTILCLFSLHYEPQWLKVLCALLNGLATGGKLYFSEDSGFRAALDGSPAALKDFPDIQEVFRDRLTTASAAPWLPDISASDASLMREILELFGDTRLVQTFDAKRRTFRRLEPDCYLPWNNKRTQIAPDLVERVRKRIPSRSAVTEQILLYEFTKSGVHHHKIDLYDISDPRSRMIWRALSDRTGRAVGRLIVSQTEGEVRRNDYPFRKAALAVLYQNALRHFSFWRAAELVVGALNPEITREAEGEPGDYLISCLTPHEQPRFWGASYDKPAFLAIYETRLKSRGWRWVGEELYVRGRGGVFCWPGITGDLPDDDAWMVIREKEQGELFAEFSERDTPPCVYVIDPLATTDPFLVSADNQLLYGAMIIYLESENHASVAEELRCLLFVLETSRSIVVGRAGFLEMELLRKVVRNSAAIQGPLNVLQKHQGALREISGAVEALASRLSPGFRSPGLPFMEEIQRFIRESTLFQGECHEPEQQPPEGLIPIAMDPCLLANQEGLRSELEANGIERSVTDRLFRPLTASWLYEHGPEAVAFAKTLTRPGAFPTSWVFAALNEDPTPDHCASYVRLQSESLNIIKMLVALCAARRESTYSNCSVESGALHCSFVIRSNYYGRDGLAVLKRFIEDDDGGGNTATSLRIIRQAARPQDFALNIVSGRMEVAVKYELTRVVTPPGRNSAP